MSNSKGKTMFHILATNKKDFCEEVFDVRDCDKVGFVEVSPDENTWYQIERENVHLVTEREMEELVNKLPL